MNKLSPVITCNYSIRAHNFATIWRVWHLACKVPHKWNTVFFSSPVPVKIICKFIIKSARLKIKVNFWREKKQHPCFMHICLFMSSFLNSQVLAKYALSFFFCCFSLFVRSLWQTASVKCVLKSQISYIYHYLFMNSEFERDATSIWSSWRWEKKACMGYWFKIMIIPEHDLVWARKKPDTTDTHQMQPLPVHMDREWWMEWCHLFIHVNCS